MTGEEFPPLTILNNEEADMKSMTTTVKTSVPETAGEILGNYRGKRNEKKKTGHSKKVLICVTKKRSESEKKIP